MKLGSAGLRGAIGTIAIAAWFVLAAALPGAAKPLFGSRRTLSVERIYSAPSLSGYPAQGIEWEPDSKAISYFDSDGSGDDLVTLDVKSGRKRLLVCSCVLHRELHSFPTRRSAERGRAQER